MTKSNANFYILVEGQHENPEPFTGDKDAETAEQVALIWVQQFECDTAGEYEIANGEKIICHVFTRAEFCDATESYGALTWDWRDFPHKKLTISGEYIPAYFVLPNEESEPEIPNAEIVLQ
jgi:hypothetical protein